MVGYGPLLLALVWPLVGLRAETLASGDPAKGKELIDRTCAGCHASLHQGDPNKIYTRRERKVKNVQQLLSQVRAFSTNTNAGWSRSDEIDAAAYLNQAFYHF